LDEWVNVEIMDLHAKIHKKVSHNFANKKQVQIPINELNSGLYLLNITYYKGREVKKLRIE